MGRLRLRLLLCDFVMSFMWVWSGSLIKMLVFRVLGLPPQQTSGEILKGSLLIANMFFFVWLGKATGGGSYNPLTVFSPAIFSGSFAALLFAACARIPVQALGSIVGVSFLKTIFPQIGHGPRLIVDMHKGALTEGLLSFIIVMVSLSLTLKEPRSIFMKTWISSVTKLTLNILGSDLTGGCMNPASALGWAYARGDHLTKEHVYVYWLAPLQATLLGVWTFKLLFQSHHHKEQENHNQASITKRPQFIKKKTQ